MTTVRPVIIALAAASMSACASMPRVDPQTEEQAIRDLDRRWVQAVAAKDLTSTVNMYATDAYFMAPNAPLATGQSEIRGMWDGLFKAPNLRLTFEPTRVQLAQGGDMAYDVGTYRLGFDTPQGRVDDEGKYTVVWKKVEGQWKVASDIFNSSKPLAPAPAMTTVVVEGQQPEMQATAGMSWTDLETPGFRPGAKMAVVHGNPMGTGDYTIRLRFPDGYEFPVHWHPNGEHVTVLQGTFMLGMGRSVDRAALRTYMPGDFIYAPAKMPHFGGVRGETVIQLHGEGPFAINLGSP